MKLKLIIPALFAALLCSAEGLRQDAGETFLEPLQKRDSVLIADQLRYGILLKDVPEGTPLALPVFEMKEDAPLAVVSSWQLDSVRVSKRKEQPRRYDITASLVLTAFYGGSFELPAIPVLLDGDTLVFRPSTVEVKELPVDMETFEPHALLEHQILIAYSHSIHIRVFGLQYVSYLLYFHLSA